MQSERSCAMLIQSDYDLKFGASVGHPHQIKTNHWDKDGFIPRRRTERKAWLYAASFNEHFFAALAIVDAGYAGTAFCYFFDRNSGKMIEEKISIPLAFPDSFSAGLQDTWTIRDHQKEWTIRCSGHDIDCRFSSPRMKVSLKLNNENHGFNALCSSKGRPFNFTFKNLLMPVIAEIEADGFSHTVNNSSGSIDYSIGYPPRETRWNWASFIGECDSGRPFAVNLVEHHNQGLENALWYDGQIYPLGLAKFNYQKPMDQNVTTIDVEDFNLNLKFKPEGARSERLNLLAVSSDFVQPFGSFTGEFILQNKKVIVSGLGVVEDHYAKW